MSPLRYKNLDLSKILRRIGISCMLLILGSYIVWQARFLIVGPEMSIKTLETIQDERVITLQGQVANVVSLQLNGSPIRVDPEGNFSTGLVLENGYTIARIDAKDRYGRSVSWEKGLVYNGEY